MEVRADAVPTASWDAADMARRRPTLSAVARREGIVAVHTVPVGVGGATIGALNPFRDHEGPFSSVETDAARAVAASGAVGIAQLTHVAEGERARAQSQEAVEGRVLLEQAEGALAERHRIHSDEAFTRLRAAARTSRRRLRAVAQQVLDELTRGASAAPGRVGNAPNG